MEVLEVGLEQGRMSLAVKEPHVLLAIAGEPGLCHPVPERQAAADHDLEALGADPDRGKIVQLGEVRQVRIGVLVHPSPLASWVVVTHVHPEVRIVDLEGLEVVCFRVVWMCA